MNTLKGLVKPPATPSRYPRTTSHRTGPSKTAKYSRSPSLPAPGAPPRSPARGNPRPGAPPGLPSDSRSRWEEGSGKTRSRPGIPPPSPLPRPPFASSSSAAKAFISSSVGLPKGTYRVRFHTYPMALRCREITLGPGGPRSARPGLLRAAGPSRFYPRPAFPPGRRPSVG